MSATPAAPSRACSALPPSRFPDDLAVYVAGNLDNAVAVFFRDLVPPSNPAVVSTSHTVGVWSNNSVFGDTGGAWEEVALKGVPLPTGTVSADVHFVAIADSDPDSHVDVGFDLLVLRYPPTVIFVDGFESGDTSAWSSTIEE